MLKGVSVLFDDPIDGVDLWVVDVPVEWKAVVNLTDVAVVRNSTETKHREHLVVVVWLDHISHILDRLLVLIVFFEILKVETIHIIFVPIWGSVVYGSDHRDCPAAAQVLHECGSLKDWEICDMELCTSSCA